MKKKGAREEAKTQEVYSCTNQDVLNALFVGVNTNQVDISHSGLLSGLPMPGVVGQIAQLSDDSSAEEDEDMLRQHSRIMKQREFEQLKRDGYIQQQDSSRLNNQIDDSSRQNLLESGSLQMQNSTSSPPKSALETSPAIQTLQGAQPQLSGSFKLQQSQQSNLNQNQNQMVSGSAAMGPLFAQQPVQPDQNIQTPLTSNIYDMQMFGGNNNLSVNSGKSKRGRPISAYPIPGSHPGFLNQISESHEQSTQASHFSKFTHSLARNHASRKQYVPHNIETFEKEKLYTETISLKKQRNDTLQQNTILKTHLKAIELDLRKKDTIIQQLTNEIKIGANQQNSSLYPYSGMVNQSQLLSAPAEVQALLGSGTFHASRHSRQMQSQLKTQQLVKQNTDFRKRIKELKCDVALKETEVQNLQRTLKFTKLKEFEIELQTYSKEILRLKNIIMNEKAKPRIDPAQFAAIQNQLIMERQQMQQVVQIGEQQKQDIEKLTQANGHSKQKLARSKIKLKKLITVKKRQDTKIKILEQKVNQAKNELERGSAKNSKIGSRIPRSKGSKGNNSSYPGDAECYDQLQTQLEINQILIDKLDSMGIDVRELIRDSQGLQGVNEEQQQQDEQDEQDQDVRMVIFTFVGPEGLIEGGDNQQFEMPIDFNQIQEVQQIKDVLKKELVMDSGIDLILREKQSGQILEYQNDIHLAVDSGDGILVQFVENEPQGNQGSSNNDMANINEEDEKSEYSEDEFEEDKEEPQVVQVPTVPRVPLENVAKGLNKIKLLFMIKKIPQTHMVKYLLKKEALIQNEDGEECVSTKSLATIFERKFSFKSTVAKKIARFFIEGPPGDEGASIEEKDHVLSRELLIERFKKHISNYMIYNSLAIESMLTRLQGIMSGKQSDYLDDLNLEDEDSNGFLPLENIIKVWKYSGFPTLDEELNEFFEFLALRVSPSLKEVSYDTFCKAFENGFSIDDCQHDDETPFDATAEEPDDQDLARIRQKRQANLDQSQGANQENAKDASQMNKTDEEEPEIDSDDLMLYIDEALNKIVSKLPETNKKTHLNKKLLPLAKSIVDSQQNETLLILQPQNFIQFMVQSLGVSFSDKELYCLLHILVRESENQGVDESNSKLANESLNQTQDNSGYILYRDVYTLVRNYLRKQKIMEQSIGLGLDYQVLTKATFDFLLRIKQVLNGSDEKQNNQAKTDKQQQAAEAKNFREVFAKNIVQKQLNKDVNLDLIEFDDFFDGLFMKFKIMCPPKDTMEQLKFLLCVQFGPNIKESSYFLVQKIERVLYDLDYVYVNLVKILREANHEKLQQEAVKRLRQRYDFVSRGFQKSTVAASPGKAKSEIQSIAEGEGDGGSRQKAKPQRPMSSKPRKQVKNVSVERTENIKFDDIVDEDALEDEIENDGGIPSDDIAEDEVEKAARKHEYDRQKTKDIGFELPADDDEDEDNDELDYDINDEFEDDIDDEDNEAIPVDAGKKKKVPQVMDDDDIDDDYFYDEDQDHQDQVPIQETKTLNQKQGSYEIPKGLNQAVKPVNNVEDDEEMENIDYEDDFGNDAFEEDEIQDDYD